MDKKKTNRYLDELDKKILKLDKYHDYDDYEYKGIKDKKDLFKLSIDKDHYKPILVKSGYNNNYVQYESKGDRILTIQEYLALIEKYLRELINRCKNEGEWKIQLTAEINFIYKENLQEKMKGSDFEFDGVNFLYYDFNKTSINRSGSYIDSPKWLKDKKSTINPKNNDDKCFQYTVTLALNLDNIDNHPERISRIKPFIDQYNWKDIK